MEKFTEYCYAHSDPASAILKKHLIFCGNGGKAVDVTGSGVFVQKDKAEKHTARSCEIEGNLPAWTCTAEAAPMHLSPLAVVLR
jgi:hypothetical protein